MYRDRKHTKVDYAEKNHPVCIFKPFPTKCFMHSVNLISIQFLLDLWNSFDQIFCCDTNVLIPEVVACKTCKKVLRYQTKNGSSNALSHAEKHIAMKNTIETFLIKPKGLNLLSGDKDRLMQSFVQFVTKDIRPYQAVEGEGMLDLLNTIWNLGARYGAATKEEIIEVLPSAVTVSRHVRKSAKEKKTEMANRLSNAFASSLFIAVTSDIWQDDHKHISYLAITVHYHDTNMNLCDQLIAMPPMETGRKKDAAFIKQMTEQFLELRGIPFDKKKLIFVTDRGSNIKKALQEFTRLNCFPHFINNSVRESCKIDVIQTVLDACSKLVRFIKISGLNNEFEISIKSAVKTRFNSVLTMVESILLNWDKLNSLLLRENEFHRLENIEFVVLEQLKSFLTPFKYWSNFCETTLSPSLCHVWIAIDSIIKHCTVKDDDDHLVAIMKVKALCYIEEKFVLHKFHRIATFLNPNYKSLRFSSQTLYDLTVSDTRNLMEQIPIEPSSSRRASTSSTSTLESAISSYLNQSDEVDEVERYIRLTHFADTSKNPALWWFEHKSEFPVLSKIGIAIHAVPASSTSSERAFSDSGSVLTERRVNLKPESVEDILILRSDSNKFQSRSIWN